MFLIPEEILTSTIKQKLQELKNDLAQVDRIFAGTSEAVRDELKNYLARNAIQVTKGFPMDSSLFPAYVILLGSEREEPEGLGNFIGEDDDYIEVTTYTETVTIEALGALTGFKLTHRPIQEITQIIYDGQERTEDGFIIDGRLGTVSFGTEDMIGNTATVTYQASSVGMELFGTMMVSQYRIETWTTNGDLTILLYHLLKWILLSSRDDLENAGLKRQSIGGTDIELVPMPYPEPVYRRALTLEVSTDFFWEKKHGYISRFIDESRL